VNDTLQQNSTQMSQLTDVLSEQDRKFTEACLNLDKKLSHELSDELRALDARAVEDRTRFSELCAQTSRAAAEELSRTNTKFTDVCIGLDEKFSKGASELKATVLNDFAQLEAGLKADSTALTTNLTAEMKSLDEKMTDSVIGLDQKTGVLLDEQSSKVSKTQAYLTEENEKLRTQLNSRTAELSAQIDEKTVATEERLLRRVNETDKTATAVETAIYHRADDIDRLAKLEVVAFGHRPALCNCWAWSCTQSRQAIPLVWLPAMCGCEFHIKV
jgi:hypothetical protein